MIRRSILAMAVAATLNSMAAQAVVVGDIQLHSALNEALNAEISLHRIEDNLELEGLRATLASPEAFARVGIERPYFLTGLKFTPMRNGAGEPVIQITSTAAMHDPFLNFLVEVNWSKGRVLREFTLLLDPPTSYRGAPAQIAAPQTDYSASIQRPASDEGAIQYKVPVNDTLWAIAKRHKHAHVSAKQMLDAIYRNNPGAFINNDINRLKAGKVLRIPSAQAMGGASYTQARHEYLARTSNWDATEPSMASTAPVIPLDARTMIPVPEDKGDRVELLSPGADSQAKPGKGSFEEQTLGQLEKDLLLARELNERVSSENTELQGRLKYLEAQLADMKRLLTLKHDTAAQLQEEAQLRQKTEELQAKIEEAKTEAEEAVKAEAKAKDEAAAESQIKQDEAKADEAKAEEARPEETKPEEATSASVSDEESTPAEPEVKPEESRPQEAAPEETTAASDATDESTPAEPEVKPEEAQPEEAQPEQAQPAEDTNEGTETAPASVETSTSDQAEEPKPEAKPETDQAQDAKASPAVESARPVTPEAEQDWLAMLLENPLILAGGGGLLLLLLLAFKRRQAKDKPKTVDTAAIGPGAGAAVHETMATDSTQVVSDLQGDSPDSSLIVDFTPSELAGIHDEDAADPVTEADVFMAYGRYQDARKKLLEGLERQPERNDIKLKLLEVLYASGNKDAFRKTAIAYKTQGLAAQEPEGWRRIALLGQDMDKDDPVFALDDQPSMAAQVVEAPLVAEPQFETPPETEDDEPTFAMPGVKDTYASVLSDVAQGLAELDAEPEEPISEEISLEGLTGDDLVGLKLGDSLLVPPKVSEPLVDLGAIDSGDLNLDDLDLSRLEADSQVWPLDEAETTKAKDFEHEDILGHDRVDDGQEPSIDFSSIEDQELLSRLETLSESKGLEIDSELSAVLDKTDTDSGQAGRVDLESELSTLTQELENISSDSELRLHPMDDDSLLAELKSMDEEEDLSSTRLLEDVADGRVNLDDYSIGLDSINLEQELANLEGLGASGKATTDFGLAATQEPVSSEFDIDKELGTLGDLGLAEKPLSDLDALDLGTSSIDLDHELAGLDFLNDATPAEDDQIQTKLELAQAYIEMGDAEGAREILMEVQMDGSQEQQAKAQEILNSIG